MVNTWVSDIPDDFSADLRLQLFQLPCPSPEAPPATSNGREQNWSEQNRFSFGPWVQFSPNSAQESHICQESYPAQNSGSDQCYGDGY